MTHLEEATALRANTAVHYNCFQSVVIPFSEELGVSKEQLYTLGAHFGSGMRHGSACGALSGALMVLGGLGYDEQQATALIQQFQAQHSATDCSALLTAVQEQGQERKPHCDGLVFEMIQLLDQLCANAPET
ncbi:MAG: C-GCAxxG-C-C family protein [Lawsonibacter sp.]